MMDECVTTIGLCKRYGSETCVDHLALKVPQGAVYGFLGPNGAGKTTTLKMLLGLVHPSAGSVRLLDALLVFVCIAAGVGLVITAYHKLTGGMVL